MWEDVGFEVLKPVVMKNYILWRIMPCIPLKVNQRFGGTCRLNIQGPRIRGARNQCETSRKHNYRCENLKSCFHTGFFLSLFFDPE
jgi:hypothetical protein